MRLWSIHPEYLDSRGLVALWREALLAQAVLRGATRGYRKHPQLARFHAEPDPPALIAAYLEAVHAESKARGYRFDARRIAAVGTSGRIEVTDGQIAFEWVHLKNKLACRAPELRALGRGRGAPPAPAVPRDTGRRRGVGKALSGTVRPGCADRYVGSKPSGRCHAE